MLKKLVTVLILISVMQSSAYSAAAAALPQDVRAKIQKLGTGEQTRVEVKLRDGSKVSGYLVDIAGESFVVSNPSTHIGTVVEFTEVKKVKGYNLSTGQKVAIGVGIGAGVGLLLFWIWLENAD